MILQNQTHLLTLHLKNNSVPVSGLTFADVDVVLKKEGANAQVKVLDALNFLEVDSVLLPGVYSLILAPSDTDVLGPFLVHVSGVGFDTLLLDLSVVTESLDSKIARVLGLLQENMRITDHQYDQNNNLISARVRLFPTPQDTLDITNQVATYTLTAAYDASNRLRDYRVLRDI